MLNEQRASSLHYDTAADTLCIEALTAFSRSGTVGATLLLDSAGHLVGVDIDPDAGTRMVVMLGPHESIARSVAQSAVLDGKRVLISKARGACRGHEPNPYWTGKK